MFPAIVSSKLLIQFFTSSKLLLIPSNVFFISVIIFFISDRFFYVLYLSFYVCYPFVEVLSEFIYSSLSLLSILITSILNSASGRLFISI